MCSIKYIYYLNINIYYAYTTLMYNIKLISTTCIHNRTIMYAIDIEAILLCVPTQRVSLCRKHLTVTLY